jgi:hypothetical protein
MTMPLDEAVANYRLAQTGCKHPECDAQRAVLDAAVYDVAKAAVRQFAKFLGNEQQYGFDDEAEQFIAAELDRLLPEGGGKEEG